MFYICEVFTFIVFLYLQVIYLLGFLYLLDFLYLLHFFTESVFVIFATFYADLPKIR